MKTFEEYQKAALATAQYPRIGANLVYPALKLAGESGEAADKIGKWWRNSGRLLPIGGADLTPEQIEALVLEVGDVLWYIAALAMELNIPMEEIAAKNIAKLAGRRERGTIKGEGDNR